MNKPQDGIVFFDYGGVMTTAQPILLEHERVAAVAAGIAPDSLHSWFLNDVDESTGAFAAALRGETELAAVIADRQQKLDSNGVALDAKDLLYRTIERPVVAQSVELVRSVRRLGLRTILASNQNLEFVPYVERALPLDELFDDVVFSCAPDVALQKPLPAFFEYLLARFDVAHNRCLFVDDVDANVRSATACGMQAVLYSDNGESRDEVRIAASALAQGT